MSRNTQALADEKHIPFLEASAKNNYHVNEVFITLCTRIKDAAGRSRTTSSVQQGLVRMAGNVKCVHILTQHRHVNAQANHVNEVFTTMCT